MKNHIPITIGVIGHRDIIINEEVKTNIETLFTELHSAYPNTPIVLYSQLAEGADIEVAEIFLKFKKTYKKCFQLFVPLPCTLEVYRNKFNHVSRTVFDDIYQQSDYSFEVESRYIVLNYRYRDAARWVVDHSNIVLALWNGEFNMKLGGTSDTISYMMNQNKAIGKFNLLLSFLLPRHSDPNIHDFNNTEHGFDSQMRTLFNGNIYRKFERFNKDISRLSQDTIDKSKEELIRNTNEPIHDSTWLDYYSIFDALALQKSNKVNLLIKNLLILSGVIIFVFEIFKHFGKNFYLLGLTIILIGLGVAQYKLALKKNIHHFKIEYRLIGEALRIQFFWSQVRIHDNVFKHLTLIHKNEFEWLNQLIKSIPYTDYNQTLNFEFVEEYWLNKQLEYLKKKVLKLKNPLP